MDQMTYERACQEAARWYARLQAIDCSAEDRVACERWRSQDPVHARAYALAERVALDVDRLAADARLQALADRVLGPVDANARANRNARRWAVPAALAASLVLAVGAVYLQGRFAPEPATVYATAATERRAFTLSDGSVVELDVASELSVRMTPERRQIELVAGRALFEVAHDASRPFSVAAGGSRTTALGTRFQVQQQEQRVIVTLAEGSVAVDNESPQGSWQEQLEPGEQLSIDKQTATRAKRNVDPLVTTSWTHGHLSFRSTRLADAIEEVNRYSTRKLRLGDATLADMAVSGGFLAGESDSIATAFAAVLPIRVVAGDGELILFRRYD
jgi:transmembrane sensor